MAREGDKWRVVKGDCLWNIAKSSYNNAYYWTKIADVNGISRSTALIYPGQLLILPGITAGYNLDGSTTANTTTSTTAKSVTFQWWALDAGTDKDMFCTWTYSRDNTAGYNIEIWYNTGSGGDRRQTTTTTDLTQYGFTADDKAKTVTIKVKPYSSTYEDSDGNTVYYWEDGEWATKTYDFSNNPPLTPDTPNVELTNSRLKCTLENIDEDINGDTIEFVIYKNNTIKYQTGLTKINSETRYVSYECNLDAGGSYTVRCRAVRNGNIYSNWSDYSSAIVTVPTAPTEITDLQPQVVSEQGSKQYGVYVEWTSVDTAKYYEIQYTTNVSYFDISDNVETVTTSEDQGNKYLITNIELGHEYFFRVCAVNDQGKSDFTPIKSTTLGSKPSAPTTWSNTSNCVIGEDLNLYWVHNSTDGSLESMARINIKVTDSSNPDLEPMEYTKIVRNEKPEEDKDKTSVYTINTDSSEWSFVKQGYVITWKVQTAGVVEEYSDWSVEREVNVYMQPELEIDIRNQNGQSINEINTFPFYINVYAKPAAQIPLSYYIEIIANQGYQTVDDVGKSMVVNAGDKVYTRYYDPTTNAWNFMAEMTPGNVDLQNGINYTVNCTVAMNSSLTASNSASFDVYWSDMFYETLADVIINDETLEASIHPYCNEFYVDDDTQEILPKLSDNCTLSVYRREYDGSFTLIASGIENTENTYITDPHPSLDYARYRVIATSKDTGSISYSDIPGIKVGEPSIVIQWSEDWSNFDSDGGEIEEPAWSGSMIRIPYNVDISETRNVEVEMVEYVGREHPVSYYGTQLGESATWNCEIPREDTDTIYALRRLSKYGGDVYVREPSGLGYWANVAVSFNLKHLSVTVPVTFTVTRVEGEI